jgi:hypothetical protein
LHNEEPITDHGNKIPQIPKIMNIDIPEDIVNSTLPIAKETAPFVVGRKLTGNTFLSSLKCGVGYHSASSQLNPTSEAREVFTDFEAKYKEVEARLRVLEQTKAESTITYQEEIQHITTRKIIKTEPNINN